MINERVPGPPLAWRLVVSRVCDPSGQTLAHRNELGYSWNPANWGPGSGMPSAGILSATVPGSVWGWDEVLHRFGTMTFKETLQSAVDYADNGFPVSERIANDWRQGAHPESLGWRDRRRPAGAGCFEK